MSEVEIQEQAEFSNFWLSALLVLIIFVLASSPLLGRDSDAARLEFLRTADSAPVPPVHSDQTAARDSAVLGEVESAPESDTGPDDAGEAVVEAATADGSDLAADEEASGEANENAGLSGLAFDLARMSEGARSASSDPDAPIEVRKPLFSNGVQLGSLTVMIDRSSALHAAPGELQAILAQSGASEQLDKFASADFVSFSRLRQSGIDLRYDPVSDRIILQS